LKIQNINLAAREADVLLRTYQRVLPSAIRLRRIVKFILDRSQNPENFAHEPNPCLQQASLFQNVAVS